MDRGAWQDTVQRVIKSWTGLSTHTQTRYFQALNFLLDCYYFLIILSGYTKV